MINGVIIIKVKELTKMECLKLALEYSISEKHRESLIRRIKSYGIEVEESKSEDANNNYDESEQIGFL
ncbi:hypothetical protein [Clostridium thailandense]|uniref:hypothetical protein n=1 Tax=Clostridium thailandense TaxID=2794346 RepID=UPI00398A450B